MPDSQTALPGTQKRIGDSKYLVGMLREADYEVVDFGDSQLKPDEEMRPVLDAQTHAQVLRSYRGIGQS